MIDNNEPNQRVFFCSLEKRKVYLNHFSIIWQHYLLVVETNRVVREYHE